MKKSMSFKLKKVIDSIHAPDLRSFKLQFLTLCMLGNFACFFAVCGILLK